MESIGEKIRKSREDKGYSLDQVARDTHISRRFLEALESENFSSMPGESYVVGFLRSYSEYLGLDSTEIVGLYHNLKIQEQPAPQELFDKPAIPRGLVVGIAAAVIIIGSLVAILVYASSQIDAKNNDAKSAVHTNEDNNSTSVAASSFSSGVLERKFVPGEHILLPSAHGDVDVGILLKDDQVHLQIGATLVALTVSDTASPLDVDQDGKPDVRVSLRKLDLKPAPGSAVIRFDREVQPTNSVADASSGNSEVVAGQVATSRTKQAIAIPENVETTKIGAQLVFGASTVASYQSDLGKAEERLFAAGEVVALSGNEWVRFALSNGSAASLKVATRVIPLGDKGEVVAWGLGWRKDSAGVRQLELQPQY